MCGRRGRDGPRTLFPACFHMFPRVLGTSRKRVRAQLLWPAWQEWPEGLVSGVFPCVSEGVGHIEEACRGLTCAAGVAETGREPCFRLVSTCFRRCWAHRGSVLGLSFFGQRGRNGPRALFPACFHVFPRMLGTSRKRVRGLTCAVGVAEIDGPRALFPACFHMFPRVLGTSRKRIRGQPL